MATWHAEAVPHGAHPVPVVVPSVSVKSKLYKGPVRTVHIFKVRDAGLRLGEDNDPSDVVSKVVNKLVSSGRIDCRG